MSYSDQYYEEYAEQGLQATQEAQDSYQRMHRAFDEYINAIEDDWFNKVFEFAYNIGYQKGKEDADHGKKSSSAAGAA